MIAAARTPPSGGATCLTPLVYQRPRLFYAWLVASRVTIVCYTFPTFEENLGMHACRHSTAWHGAARRRTAGRAR